MCNRYVSPQGGDNERCWPVEGQSSWRGAGVHCRSPGTFIRAARQIGVDGERVKGMHQTTRLRLWDKIDRCEELRDQALVGFLARFGHLL